VIGYDGILLPAALAVPLAGALLVVAAHRSPNIREAISLLTGVVLLAVVVCIACAVGRGEPLDIVVADPFPGLTLALSAEPLGLLFALVASGLWIVTTIYAIGYMRAHHEQHQTRFYAFFAIAIASTMGIAFADNMLTLFVFYEALTISTYPLVTHAGTPEAKRAGRVYLGILLGTSILLQLVAIVGTYVVAGTLDFEQGGILDGAVGTGVAGLLLALYLFGIGKAALMPFHRWLPAAMVAPTPVSALLHAVAVVKAGVFTVLKVATFIFGFDLLRELWATDAMQIVAAFTMIAASLVALTRDNLKARLAYSTISQLAYIVLGALLATEAGFIGGGLHIATHAFGKITLFFCAGAILVATHRTQVSQLDGLGRAMPLTMAAFLIGSLSIIGLPPFGGLWSKWFLIEGAWQSGQGWIVAAFIVSTLLNIGYLLPIPFRAFFRPPVKPVDGIREAPAWCLVAIGITCIGCVVLFFAPDPIVELLQAAISSTGIAP
jgi:multicomponent Na+:H+ antiporter subunit D